MLRTSSVIALSLVLHACAARTTPSLPPSGAAARERLGLDVAALLADPSAARGQWAVSVFSLDKAETLVSLHESRLLVPASTQKLLTAAAAAERLGWDYRFTTRIVTTGTIVDGTLNGDLVVIGNGDPTINPRDPARWRVFDDWAAALRSKGIRAISGHVIGHDDSLAEPGWGRGWAWDDLVFGYGSPVGALQFHENQIELNVGPGREPGARAIVATAPFGNGILVDQQLTTAEPGTTTSIDFQRIPGTSFLAVKGRIASDAKPVTLLAAVDNPTRLYLNAFREALGRHDISVAGNMVDIDELTVPPPLDNAAELIADRSPPLAEILDVTLKWSRNGYAETLLYALSGVEPATDAKGLEVLRTVLSGWGIAPETYLARDGSGLSRYDLLSTDALVRLLAAMAAEPRHSALFRSALPVAGESGLLANRMKGTIAASRVQAKTGSMTNVRSLAGYLSTLDGEQLVFAIMLNNYGGPGAEIDALIDKVVVRLVEFRR